MRGHKVRSAIRLLMSTDAAEIAEAALILPLTFMFIFGVLWFGLTYNTWSTVVSAAREGARAAARPQCGLCGPPGNNWQNTNLPGDAAVATVVTTVMQTSRVDPTKIVAYTPPSLVSCQPPAPVPATICDAPSSNITVCRFVLLNPGGSPQQCGTVVSFQYPFASSVPFPSYPNLGFQSVTITAVGQSLMQY